MARSRRTAWLAVALGLALAACSSSGPRGPLEFGSTEKPAEEAGPLGGPSLDQRRENMARMYRDLVHFRTSLENAARRGDRTTEIQLAYFVDSYMSMHLDPLLAGEWQSRHPELFGMDADLRLAKADVLQRMRERGRADDVLDELASRYAGREDMLVHYPIGAQSPLGKAVKLLRETH